MAHQSGKRLGGGGGGILFCIRVLICFIVQNKRAGASVLIKGGAAGDKLTAMIVSVCHCVEEETESQESCVYPPLLLSEESVISVIRDV